MQAKDIVEMIFLEALGAVDPLRIVREYAESIYADFSENKFRDLIVVGFGKASYQMAMAVEEVFGADVITAGIVITKYGHAERKRSAFRRQPSGDLKKIKVYEAGHPIPDENGLKATEAIINLLKNSNEKTLVLCLISGGGSALLVSPCEGITLAEKQSVTNLLLHAGADIAELNAVRKHLSKVKGGRLAEIAYPAEIISLMISDVIGDKLDVIASGTTASDSSTFQDALDVINKYKLSKTAPEGVLDIIKKGSRGIIPETPKQDNPVFKNVRNIIIGSNQKALEAAKTKALSLGFETEILSSEITGEAKDAGKRLAEKAKETWARGRNGTICYISGGETTVTVQGSGKGGRNTELALSFAMEIEGTDGITLLSAGTDGTDGPTDAAGAIVNGRTIVQARSLGMNSREYLDNNDSYHFFKKIDSLLITGPTGTNVMDVQIILVQKGE